MGRATLLLNVCVFWRLGGAHGLTFGSARCLAEDNLLSLPKSRLALAPFVAMVVAFHALLEDFLCIGIRLVCAQRFTMVLARSIAKAIVRLS